MRALQGIERYENAVGAQPANIGMRAARAELIGPEGPEIRAVPPGLIWALHERGRKDRKDRKSERYHVASHGPTWALRQVIVSRMRYIAVRTDTPVRIVGLSTALANAQARSPHSALKLEP